MLGSAHALAVRDVLATSSDTAYNRPMFDVDEAVATAERKVAFLKAARAAYPDLNTHTLGPHTLYISAQAHATATHVEVFVQDEKSILILYVEIEGGRVYGVAETFDAAVPSRLVLHRLSEKHPDAYRELVNVVRSPW